MRTCSTVSREAVGGLVGQAVDQVDIDAVEAQRASLGDQIAGHLVGLDAMDGLLHFGIEILNAQAQAIEAQAAQAFQVLRAGDARIDFDADFGVGGEGESLGGEAEEIFHLRGRQIGWRAAAPVKLHDGAGAETKPLTCSISRLSVARYGGAALWSLVMTTLQAQNRHRLSQKGRCM